MTTTVAAVGSARSHEIIRVERWPAEYPLFTAAVVISILAWILLTISIIGIAYVAIIAVLIWFLHMGFVAHVRGNGVRLGPDQFPELHARIEEIARRMEMEQVPEAYLMQAGGALNAFATRFLRRHMVVLFSDLLEACHGNDAARDMIIGHELGHIHAGHLRFRWLIMPASFIPFLGSALSRAREFTCDRYGYATAGDHSSALLGLTILAAGGKHAPSVNRTALVRQRQDLNTGLMTLATWFSTHPPLAKRLYALDPSLGAGYHVSNAGTWRALGIVGLMLSPFILGGFLAATVLDDWLVEFREAMEAGTVESQIDATDPGTAATSDLPPLPNNPDQVLNDAVTRISAMLNAELAAGRELPADLEALAGLWVEKNPGSDIPRDPYDGDLLGYARTATGYSLYSSGPDRKFETADDLEFKFPREP